MNEFFEATLKPEIFWSALASMGTLLAVSVALLAPIRHRYSRNNRLENLIKIEIKGNFRIIKHMQSRKDYVLPGGRTISASSYIDGRIPSIDLQIWHQYQYKLASDRPKSYEKYESINCNAEAIVKLPKEHPPILRVAMITDMATDFVSNYEKVFV